MKFIFIFGMDLAIYNGMNKPPTIGGTKMEWITFRCHDKSLVGSIPTFSRVPKGLTPNQLIERMQRQLREKNKKTGITWIVTNNIAEAMAATTKV